MLIIRRVRMLTPLLAAKMPRKGDPEYPRRYFTKDPKAVDSVRIQNDLRRWHWAFLEARDACAFTEVATASIIPLPFYETKRTSTFTRNYKFEGRPAVDKFESVTAGHIATFSFTLTGTPPPGCDGNGRFVRSPDVAEFDQMLAYIGEFLGMSEWGHAYLYGRFAIQSEEFQTKQSDESIVPNHTKQQ